MSIYSGEPLTMADCKEHTSSNCGSTQIFQINSSFKWTVGNFSRILKSNSCSMIESPPFFSGPNNQDKWRLELKTDRGKCVSVCLHLVKSKRRQIFANFKFSVISGTGKHIGCDPIHYVSYGFDPCSPPTMESLLSPNQSSDYYSILGKGDLLEEKESLLPSDALTIYCELSYFEESNDNYDKLSVSDKPASDPSNMAEDFQSLLESADFSDVILVVKEKEINAHRNILAARSPVFKAMFTNQKEDYQKKKVEITEVEYGDLEELLRFMYTGKLPSHDRISAELLSAADKYEVKSLKVKCEMDLVVGVLNAATLLILADRHSASVLKERTVDFISENISMVRETSGWKELVDSRSRLLDEVIQELITKTQ